MRNLQRFLLLPRLSIKWLWLPLVKLWLQQAERGESLNHQQRRHRKKKTHQKHGYWLIAMDRTQWKGRNILMLTLVWGTHALPLYWAMLKHPGNSALKLQKRLLKVALSLFQETPVLVLADREFHSPKLAQWLDEQGVCFALRQKKELHFQPPGEEPYQVLQEQGFQPGMSHFYLGVKCNKAEGLDPFNIAVYWKRKYRPKGPKEPWYILTNLPSLKQPLRVYRC